LDDLGVGFVVAKMVLLTSLILQVNRRHPRHLQLGIVSMFYCLHAVAGGNCRIRFMDKTLEFSSTVLPALLPYISGADVLL